jgi:toxin HigB-1
MIRNFKDPETQLLWETGKCRHFPAAIRKPALRKLAILHWATSLFDLSVPGGNRLEALSGDRRGQHSIRINDKYRLCFEWQDGDAHNVEIVDYH